jgi:fatty-acyl-CoA synthase
MAGSGFMQAADAGALRGLTVGGLLREAADRAPDTIALVEGVADPAARRRWTYAELLEESEQAARALAGRFSPGERVAVWANNIPEWVLLEFAAALAGVTLVTVNPALREGELRHVLGDSQAAGVFLLRAYRDNPMADTLEEVRPGLPTLREVVRFDEWTPFRASGSPTEPLPWVGSRDAVQIQYTSGTTGIPKGAILRHGALTDNARMSYCPIFDMRPGEAFVNPMPLFHTAGCVLGTLAPVASLGTHVLMPWFDPALELELIESERGACFGGVPTMLTAMLEHPRFAHTDLSCVRYALSGGAPVPPELVRRVEARVGVPMAVIYAQTEASPGIAMTRLDDTPEDRAQTVGRPLPHCEVVIADPRTGDLVAPGTVGELRVRGYNVMAGYVGGAEPTATAIDAEGWLHTGDLAVQDERGYLSITGRIKDMIIRGGENIYPREIEDMLLAHPAVNAVAVVGVPDELWGEQVAAFIRPAPGVTPDEAELSTYVRAHLAPHKAPRIWRFVDAFPMTGSGKVRKHVLREQYVQEAAADPPE